MRMYQFIILLGSLLVFGCHDTQKESLISSTARASLTQKSGNKNSAAMGDAGGSGSGNMALPEAADGADLNVAVDPSSGQLQVALPLPPLPNRAGLDPNIGLAFSGANVDVGGGFGIGFFMDAPSISVSNDYGVPLPKTTQADPFPARVTLGNSRLVYQGTFQEAGKPNAVAYRLDASDDATRVLYYSEPTNINTLEHTVSFRGFLVLFPDGTQEIYTEDPDQSEGDSFPGSSGARVYSATRFPLRYRIAPNLDLIEYRWTKDATDNRVYLESVRFAGGRSEYKLTMARQTAPYTGTSYQSGFKQQTGNLYTKLVASFDGEPVHRWYFVYRSANIHTTDIFAHPDVIDLARDDFSSSAAPFIANNSLAGIYRVGAGDSPVSGDTGQWPLIRFEYTGVSTLEPRIQQIELPNASGLGPAYGTELLDVNGDGLTDLLKSSADGAQTLVSLNRGEMTDNPWTTPKAITLQRKTMTGDFYPSFREASGNVWLPGDFDGNGVDDLLQIEQNNSTAMPSRIWLYPGQISTDGAYTYGAAGPAFASQFPLDYFKNGRVQIVDLNGDSRFDLVMATGSGNAARWTFLINGTGSNDDGVSFMEFAAAFAFPTLDGFNPSLSRAHNRFVDVNGDGLVDFVVLKTLTGGQSGLCVFENRGKLRSNVDQQLLWAKDLTFFGDQSANDPQCGTGYFMAADGIESVSNLHALWVMDVNRDHLADLVDLGASSDVLRVWLGGGRQGYDFIGEYQLPEPLRVDPTNRYNSRAMDIDGDGAEDIVVFEPGEMGGTLKIVDFSTYLGVKQAPPALLTEIHEGEGLHHGVHYSSILDESLRDGRQSGFAAGTVPYSWPVVKRHLTANGNEPARITEYRYHQPYGNLVERGFLGFGKVERLTYGDADKDVPNEDSVVERFTYSLSGAIIEDRYLADRIHTIETYRPVPTAQMAENLARFNTVSQQTPQRFSQGTAARDEAPLAVDRMLSVTHQSWGFDESPVHKNQATLRRLTQSTTQSFGAGCTAALYGDAACDAALSKQAWTYDACNRVLTSQTHLPSVSGPEGSGTLVEERLLVEKTTYVDACTQETQRSSKAIAFARPGQKMLTDDTGQTLGHTEYSYETPMPYPASVTETVFTDTRDIPEQLQSELPAERRHRVSYAYDAYKNILLQQDDIGVMQQLVYDDTGVRLTAERNDLGHTTQIDYSPGYLSATQITTPQGETQTIAYDSLQRPVLLTSSEGNQTRIAYRKADASGVQLQLIREVTTDTLESQKLLAFWADGVPIGVAGDNAAGQTRVDRHVVYGRRGSPVADLIPYQTDQLPADYFSAGVFPAAPWIIECATGVARCMGYDALGRIAREQNVTGLHQSTYTYETWGVDRQESIDGQIQHRSYVGRTNETYAIIDERDAVFNFTRDALGNLLSIRLPLEQTPRPMRHDSAGNLVWTSIPGGLSRVWMRDERGRTVQQMSHDRDLSSWERIAFEYDTLDRPVRAEQIRGKGDEATESVEVSEWYYDGAAEDDASQIGRMVRAVATDNLLGRTYEEQFSYDKQGRLRRHLSTLDGVETPRSYEASYVYSQGGLLLSYTDPFGNELSHLRAASGDLTGIIWSSEKTTAPLMDHVTYNARNQVTSFSTPYDGLIHTAAYDTSTGWLLGGQICKDASETCVQQTSYTHRADGRLTFVRDGDFTMSFAYSPRKELAKTQWGDHTFSNTYDAAGHAITLGDIPGGEFSREDLPVALPTDGSCQLDGFGRVKSCGNLRNIDYDPQGRIRKIELPDKHLAFGYSALGRRISRDSGGEDTLVTYPTATTRDNGQERQSLIRVDGKRLALIVNGERVYSLLTNQVGAVEGVVGEDGSAVIGSWRFTPYGHIGDTDNREQVPLSSMELVASFTGQVADEESGLVLMGARDYLPGIGAFVTPDPWFLANPEECVGSTLECNLYTYVGHDPVNFVDESGFEKHHKNAHKIHTVSKNKISSSTKKYKQIALGKDLAIGGLKALAKKTGASAYPSWAKDGITRRTVTNRFGRALHDAVKRADRIHFSLDGIPDPSAAVNAGARGFTKGNITHAELHYIANTPSALAKTTFYRNNKAVESPF